MAVPFEWFTSQMNWLSPLPAGGAAGFLVVDERLARAPWARRERAHGDSYRTIARRHNVSHEHVRQVVIHEMLRPPGPLADEFPARVPRI